MFKNENIKTEIFIYFFKKYLKKNTQKNIQISFFRYI